MVTVDDRTGINEIPVRVLFSFVGDQYVYSSPGKQKEDPPVSPVCQWTSYVDLHTFANNEGPYSSN